MLSVSGFSFSKEDEEGSSCGDKINKQIGQTDRQTDRQDASNSLTDIPNSFPFLCRIPLCSACFLLHNSEVKLRVFHKFPDQWL